METKELQARIKGKVTTATDYGYEQLRRAILPVKSDSYQNASDQIN